MISYEKRKLIFQKYFLYYQKQQTICTDLKISRGSVTKIIKEFRDRILELGLAEEDNLQEYTDRIVVEVKRRDRKYKRRVVTDIHVDLVKSLWETNEKYRTRSDDYKSLSKLYDEFDEMLMTYIDSVEMVDIYARKLRNEALSIEERERYEVLFSKYMKEYRKACDLLKIPYADYDGINREIKYISRQTFYRLVGDIKKEKAKKMKEVLGFNDLEEAEMIDENSGEFESGIIFRSERPISFANDAERILWELENPESNK